MLRIRRSVQATYNTQVNFMASQMLKVSGSATGTGEQLRATPGLGRARPGATCSPVSGPVGPALTSWDCEQWGPTLLLPQTGSLKAGASRPAGRPAHQSEGGRAWCGCGEGLPMASDAHLPPPVSDLAPGQSGMDDMKLLEQRAEQLAAEAERDQPPRAQSKILFVR